MSTATTKTSDSVFFPFSQLSWFKMNPVNRLHEQNRNHIERIKTSMAQYGFQKEYAIIVSSDGTIKEGHHRFQAAYELGIGIWATKNDKDSIYDLARISGINKKWGTDDWIRANAHSGIENYNELQEFLLRHPNVGIKLAIAVMLVKTCQPDQKTLDEIKHGAFYPTISWKEADDIVSKLEDLWNLVPEKRKVGKRINLRFALAHMKLMQDDKYDHSSFIKSVSCRTEQIRPQSREEDNRDMLVTLYNYHKTKGNKIRLD